MARIFNHQPVTDPFSRNKDKSQYETHFLKLHFKNIKETNKLQDYFIYCEISKQDFPISKLRVVAFISRTTSLLQHVTNIEIIKKVFHIFFLLISRTWLVCYTSSPSQVELAMFQVPRSHMWLVASGHWIEQLIFCSKCFRNTVLDDLQSSPYRLDNSLGLRSPACQGLLSFQGSVQCTNGEGRGH